MRFWTFYCPDERTVFGRRVGARPTDEADHYFKCEACSGYFDARDYGAVLDHEEPLPHPACDQLQ
jgi:hypothetical protein